MFRVYGLVASDEPEHVRYVGSTTQPLKRRLRGHYLTRKGSEKVQWIKEVHARSALVLIVEFRVYRDIYSMHDAEAHWINHFRSKGHKLLNHEQRFPVAKESIHAQPSDIPLLDAPRFNLYFEAPSSDLIPVDSEALLSRYLEAVVNTGRDS